jgi:hypothetical protein
MVVPKDLEIKYANEKEKESQNSTLRSYAKHIIILKFLL